MELNRKNVKWLMLLITFALVMAWGINNPAQVAKIMGGIFSLISPFLLGFCFAFVLNILLRPLEKLWNHLWCKSKSPLKDRLRRPVCMLLSLLLLLGVVAAVFLVLIPQLRETVLSISAMVPQAVDKVELWWQELSAFLAHFGAYLPELELDAEKIISTATDIIARYASAMANRTLSITLSIFKVFFNIVLALIISFYVLGQKEQHGRSCRRAIRAILKPRHADRFLSVVSLVDRSFTNYVTGQMTEAVILGCLCCVGMLIFRFPYAPVISVVVGFTALIPIFGAWVGGAVGAFLIVFVSPMKALWFLVFLVVLQQLENNLVYPRVVGKSVGLPGIWVLAAVTIGGGAFGILGMLMGVPTCAVIYSLAREFVSRRTENIREP